ncbi:hypothetical protein BGZ83_001731, partial [Gryganskiella cystojenkinii]
SFYVRLKFPSRSSKVLLVARTGSGSFGDLKDDMSNGQWMRLYDDLWSRLRFFSWDGLQLYSDINPPGDGTSLIKKELSPILILDLCLEPNGFDRGTMLGSGSKA